MDGHRPGRPLRGGRDLAGIEGEVLFPERDRFHIRWEQRTPRARKTELAEQKRPPIESVITQAQASAVATLEGLQLIRIQYQLRFEGVKPITFRLPADQRLLKVYLNAAAIPFEVADETLSLTVAPPRAGDQAARLELVLERRQQAFHLSGRLAFTLPAADWSVNELFVDLHLPQVFNYRWIGGSLAPVADTPEADFAHRIPTPGKRLRFHQQLVGTSPDVQVAYAVDLAGQVFRPGPGGPTAGGPTALAPVAQTAAEPVSRWSDPEP